MYKISYGIAVFGYLLVILEVLGLGHVMHFFGVGSLEVRENYLLLIHLSFQCSSVMVMLLVPAFFFASMECTMVCSVATLLKFALIVWRS